MDTINEFAGKYRFLSNFWEQPFKHEDGLEYATAEHAYQAAKTPYVHQREYVRNAIGPGQAKYRGRKVVLREDWEEIKLSVMDRVLECKFKDPTLKQLLLDTGDAILIEGNFWNDTYWGVCKGVGENNLGKLLMRLRSRLQKENIGRPKISC